jgi:PKD repeat protein
MKKFSLLWTILFTSLTLVSQQVPRDKVLLEIATGTWCPYCPGAAMGADDLVENGCEVAVIEYHNGDIFTNAASDARNAYYNVTGYPTAHFDGVLEYVGGSNTQSMYPQYLPLYQQRIAISSSYTIEIYGESVGNEYTIILVLEKVATSSASNIKARFALTESHIVHSWQGQSELNYVERLMAPDANGTPVDFSGNSEITLVLNFTKDPNWVSANCELVAFLQDDNTKECLQATMVPLDDLTPDAMFTASDQSPCINSTVQFLDGSGGDPIIWNWTFEGGNPPSSTLQNPEVTYAMQGSFDVQLIVSDGVISDTLLETNYINAIINPAQADTPTGDTALCSGTSDDVYSTPVVPWASSYTWNVQPSNAGTIAGNGNEVTFDLTTGYLGAFEIKVRADNECGLGTWSAPLQVTAYTSPLQYTLSDGAGYCEGEPGIELTLDNSETGVDYELFLSNVTTGIIIPGTGSSISFGYQTETGIYTCVGHTGQCSTAMVGNAYVHLIPLPEQCETPAGPTLECNLNEHVGYFTGGAEDAGYYEWLLMPTEAGSITGSTDSAYVDWNPEFTGMAYISVQGINICGAGPSSDALEVTVSATPTPEITGAAQVCDYDEGVDYSSPENEGSTYEWDVEGGVITDGMGTHEILVTWGAAGIGTVNLVEVTEAGCSSNAPALEVIIDDCTGIDQLAEAGISLYPNPARDILNIRGSGRQPGMYSVMICNVYGQLIYSRNFEAANGEMALEIPIAQFQPGTYSVQVRMPDGSLNGKFVKK